jgi:hypothetical protein
MKAVALTLVIVSGLVVSSEAHARRVRPLSPQVQHLLEAAVRRAPTVGRLLDIIEASDVILQIELRLDPEVPRAVTQFVTASGNVRYVRTIINRTQSPWHQIELLAHELQHVVEIATDPQVRDQDTMRRRFEALGWREGRHGPFETLAAREVELQVRRELMMVAAKVTAR